MAYVWLAFAIVFELAGTTCMKLAEGYTRLLPTIGVIVFYVLSFGKFWFFFNNSYKYRQTQSPGIYSYP